MATVTISSGVTTGGLTTSAGDQLIVLSGALVYSNTIDSGGLETLSSGATDTGVVVSSGGELLGAGVLGGVDSSYGLISGLTLGSGVTGQGYLEVFQGGVAEDLSVLGILVLSSGAVASQNTLSNNLGQAVQIELSGAEAFGTVVGGGGSNDQIEGGISEGAILLLGGNQVVISGEASDTTVSSGGQEDVESGGILSGATILSGGGLYLSAGAIVGGVTAESGAIIQDSRTYIITSGESFVDTGSTTSSIAVGGVTVESGVTLDLRSIEVQSGGSLAIASGVSLISLTVDSGAEMTLSSGATVFDATVSAGGQLLGAGQVIFTVYDQGVVSGAIAAETFIVSSAASAVDVILSYSGTVSAGGTTTGMVIGGGASASIHGSSLGTQINAGAIEFVLGGGSSLSATVMSGGLQNVEGGLAIGTIVDSGGDATVQSGGTMSSATILDGGALNIMTSGAVVSVTADSGATVTDLAPLVISSGMAFIVGSSAVTTPTTYGGLTLLSGAVFSAEAFELESGGVLTISSGAEAMSVLLDSGAQFTLSSGGIIDSAVVSSGAELFGAGGVTYDASDYGFMANMTFGGSSFSEFSEAIVYSGASASNLTVKGGNLQINAGATVTGVTLSPTVTSFIDAAIVLLGSSVDTIIGGNSEEVVHSGAGALDVMVLSGGVLSVSTDGIASEVTISSGGQLSGPGEIDGAANTAAGMITGVSVGDATDLSQLILQAGGTMSGGDVAAGSVLIVDGGGLASGVELAGEMIVSGTASNTILDYGTLEELGGGVLVGATGTGAIEYGSGLTLNGAIFNADNVVYEIGSGGVMNMGSVTSISTLVVEAGAVASGVTVAGELIASGTVSNTILDYGTLVQVSGGQLIGATGTGAIEYGGGLTLSGAVFNAGNVVYEIGPAGTMDGGEVTSISTLVVESGAVASGVTVAGEMIVSGYASNTILDYGTLYEVAGGVLVGATGTGAIEYGGGLVLSGAVFNAGNVVYEIGPGGTMSLGSVTSISTVVVEAGAVASGVTVAGEIIIDAGAAVAGGLILNGGTGLISGAAAAGQTVSFTASGGDLILDNLAGFSASIAGLANAGDKIDLGGFAYSAGETASWTQGPGSGTLTVTDGGMVAKLTLIGSYSTGEFTLSNDGKGGSYITDPPVGGGGGAQVVAFAQAMAGFGQGSEAPMAGGTAVQHQGATLSLASALIPTGSTSGFP